MSGMTEGMVHPGDRMTSRQRLLAAYRRQPVDRLPFWAKVANSTWRRSQPAEIQALSTRELLDYIRADGIFHVPGGAAIQTPRVRRESSTQGTLRTTVTHTPDGDLVERWAVDPATESWHPVVFPVKTRDDLRRYRTEHGPRQRVVATRVQTSRVFTLALSWCSRL
jgi:hypothetical protein